MIEWVSEWTLKKYNYKWDEVSLTISYVQKINWKCYYKLKQNSLMLKNKPVLWIHANTLMPQTIWMWDKFVLFVLQFC